MENQTSPSQNNPSQNNPQVVPNPEQNRMVLGILSYLGPLVIVSLIVGKADQFVKFHVKQGLVLFSAEIAAWILASILPLLWMIMPFFQLAALIFSIIGIINVAQNKEKELPLVGHLGKHFPV